MDASVEAVLSGVIRVIPDVCTFVTPVFKLSDGSPAVQKIVDGRVAQLLLASTEETHEPVDIERLRVVTGRAALYGFEFEPDWFAIGTAATLAEFLCLDLGLLKYGANEHIAEATVSAVSQFYDCMRDRDAQSWQGTLLFSPAAASRTREAQADKFVSRSGIKVIGVGGGGGNAVEHMITGGIAGVEFMCINTDSQALKRGKVRTTLQIGTNITRGLGAGADPQVGYQAAMEDYDRIVSLVEGCDLLLITAGLGGGTGTGAAPVVARIAKELGILTVAAVTLPFEMEGNKRAAMADYGLRELGEYCDSVICIPNQTLLNGLGPQSTLLDAFKSSNTALNVVVQSIAELLTRPGLIHADAVDLRRVLADSGMGLVGYGVGRGKARARMAAESAVSSPLLENIDLGAARDVLVTVTAGIDSSTTEFLEVRRIVRQFVSEQATVVLGTVIDPGLPDELRVTVIATGFPQATAAAATPKRRSQVPVAPVSGVVRPVISAADPGRGVVDYARPESQDESPLDIQKRLSRENK